MMGEGVWLAGPIISGDRLSPHFCRLPQTDVFAMGRAGGILVSRSLHYERAGSSRWADSR